MAPELHSAESFSGSKCDIFALGVLLFTMYFGIPPWTQTTEQDRTFRYYKSNVLNLFKFHGGTRQKFAAGEINEDLISLISSLLSYNAVDRPEINDIASHSFFQNIKDISDDEAASRIHSLLVDSE